MTAHVHAFEFFGGAPEHRRVRQPALGGDPAAPLRARRQRHLSRRWPPTTAWPSSPPAATGPATRPRSKRACCWPSAGSSPGCDISASPRLAEANAAIARLVDVINARPVQEAGRLEAALFESLDRPALRPLPAEPLRVRHLAPGQGQHRLPRRGLERHYYSVPTGSSARRVEVRLARSTVEVFFARRRVASHVRSYQRPATRRTPPTCPRATAATPSGRRQRIVAWAEQTGPATAELVEAILAARPHPEQGFRICLGIIRLADKYGTERLEAACARALRRALVQLPLGRVDPAHTTSTASRCPRARPHAPTEPPQRPRPGPTTVKGETMLDTRPSTASTRSGSTAMAAGPGRPAGQPDYERSRLRRTPRAARRPRAHRAREPPAGSAT